MKAKARVILDLEQKKINKIIFDNNLLNSSSNHSFIKAFIRKRVLDTPIEQFMTFKYPGIKKIYYSLYLEIDVYTYIKKIVQPSRLRLIPYRCTLSPLPIPGKISDITFETYEKLTLQALNERTSLVYISGDVEK